MGKAKTLDQAVGCFLFKESIGHFFRLSGKFFLTCQYINGNNESDDKIPKTLQILITLKDTVMIT